MPYTQEEVTEFANGLRALADFIQCHGTKLEGLHLYFDKHVSLTKQKYSKVSEEGAEEDRWDWVIDEEATKGRLKTLLDCIGSCEKEWNHGQLSVKKPFGGNVTLVAAMSREMTCTKKPTGTFRTIPAQPEKVEEEFEWICEDTSLLKLVKD